MAEPETLPSAAEDFEDFFEHSLCGYLTLAPDGRIVRSNARVVEWLGYTATELRGTRFSELLTIGGKVYYETHLAPMLRMQGFFDEVALELTCLDGGRFQVLINASERRDEMNTPRFIRLTLFKATYRRIYEENLREAKLSAEDRLSKERETSVMREQFIAVLGHDLRNPLGAVKGLTTLLQQTTLDGDATDYATMIQDCVTRMSGLIENMLDFARGRLGGGLSLVCNVTDALEPMVNQVINELRVTSPHRLIETHFSVHEPVYCDQRRLAQLFSNLLGNALTYGAADQPVHVDVRTSEGQFKLSVANAGDPIPAAAMGRLFHPFSRGDSKTYQQGLGLGLFISSEIARAHGGELTVQSDATETRFTLTMPVDSSSKLKIDTRG